MRPSTHTRGPSPRSLPTPQAPRFVWLESFFPTPISLSPFFTLLILLSSLFLLTFFSSLSLFSTMHLSVAGCFDGRGQSGLCLVATIRKRRNLSYLLRHVRPSSLLRSQQHLEPHADGGDHARRQPRYNRVRLRQARRLPPQIAPVWPCQCLCLTADFFPPFAISSPRTRLATCPHPFVVLLFFPFNRSIIMIKH